MRLPPPSKYLRRVASAATLAEVNGLGKFGGPIEWIAALAIVLALGILPSVVELLVGGG